MMKQATNEVLIAALLQHGTVKQAAEAAGVKPRTVYDRMRNDREFKSLYLRARTDIIRSAVFTINQKTGLAIECISRLMEDDSVNAATRLQAAQTILATADRFAKRLYQEEKQAELEEDPLDEFIL